jgi:predicted nucleotidyltransferase
MKKAFKDRLERMGVAIVYLFGSQATGRAFPFSDMDIGVVLNGSEPEGDTRALYQSLYELFSEAFPKAKLDIVFLQTAPLTVQYSAIKEGKVLFEKDPTFTADYIWQVMKFYLDFKPVLDYFDRIALQRHTEA